MKYWWRQLADFADYLKTGLAPRRVNLTEKHQALLQRMYPTVDWGRVWVHEGMPWFMKESFAVGTVLPSIWHPARVHIYLKEYRIEGRYTTAMLVHEGFHVLQYQDLGRMYGLGFWRGFTQHYLGRVWEGFFKHVRQVPFVTLFQTTYQHHPMEVSAYQHEANFVRVYPSYADTASVQAFFYRYPQLIQTTSAYRKSLSVGGHLAGLLSSLAVAFARPLVEFFLWIGWGLLIAFLWMSKPFARV